MVAKIAQNPKMRNPFPKGSARAFFFEWSGYSYDPKRETPALGRKRCAVAMTEAERKATELGIRFAWEHDDQTDESFRDTDDPYWLWVCVAYLNDEVVASCGGIDLGRDGSPHSDTYGRVMEAELALEALQNREGALS